MTKSGAKRQKLVHLEQTLNEESSMGFRRSIVLVTSSFLLGKCPMCLRVADFLYLNFNIGALLLGFPIFKAVCLEGRPTPEALLRLERYYGRWWEAPVAVKSLVHADVSFCRTSSQPIQL